MILQLTWVFEEPCSLNICAQSPPGFNLIEIISIIHCRDLILAKRAQLSPLFWLSLFSHTRSVFVLIFMKHSLRTLPRSTCTDAPRELVPPRLWLLHYGIGQQCLPLTRPTIQSVSPAFLFWTCPRCSNHGRSSVLFQFIDILNGVSQVDLLSKNLKFYADFSYWF